ncbi:hypothetical protein [Lewinella sp. IMCC34183]|uniref:hypothetical protein n=1 Tax=Lewinella sp. IMCC34183 TaxID=2248762 RepID=UPI0013009C2F|nr:hypothetical protein [Lewinella sp. IMCC34183]
MLLRLTLLLLWSLPFLGLRAQEYHRIPTTNLYFPERENLSVDRTHAMLSHPDYGVAIIEMSGISFTEQLPNFRILPQQYADAGIQVKTINQAALGEYESLRIFVEEPKQMYQVFFGDDRFTAMATVTPTAPTTPVDSMQILELLADIRYEISDTDPFKDTPFTVDTVGLAYPFKQQMGMIYVFGNLASQGGFMLMQLPIAGSDADLTEQFLVKMREDTPDLQLESQQTATFGFFTGYHTVLTGQNRQTEQPLTVALFVTTIEQAQLVFQFMLPGVPGERVGLIEEVVGHFGVR